VLEGSSGRRVEIPAGTTPGEIESLVKQAKELDVERIRLV